jgi:hypothetical protein
MPGDGEKALERKLVMKLGGLCCLVAFDTFWRQVLT